MRLKTKYLILLLPTTAAPTVIENKIPNVRSFVKKLDNKTKISEIGNKIPADHDYGNYITTQ